MALSSASSSHVMSSMMGWGLYELLGTEELRCMRPVCQELRQALDALVDTLALRLDAASVNDIATAAAMAKFHHSKQAASKLYVHMDYSAADEALAASRFMAVYSAHCTVSGLAAVKHCHITVYSGCDLQLTPFCSILRAMPAVESITLCMAGYTSSPKETLLAMAVALNKCQHLRTLVLEDGLIPEAQEGTLGKPELLLALSLLTRLHTLSLDMELTCWLLESMSPIHSISKLECLCVRSWLPGPASRVHLPSVRTLRVAADTTTMYQPLQDSQELHPQCKAWHAGMPNQIPYESLGTFPNLQRVEGFRIWFSSLDADMLQQLPATVRRLESSARLWALMAHIDTFEPEVLSQHLPPGCMPAVRNLVISYDPDEHMYVDTPGCLTSLLAAATHVEVLFLQLPAAIQPEDLTMLLLPLQQAPYLHTLMFDLDADMQLNGGLGLDAEFGLDADSDFLSHVASILADPLFGGKACYPSLKRLHLGSSCEEGYTSKCELEV